MQLPSLGPPAPLRPYFSRLPRVAAPLHADVQALLPAHYKYIPKHVQTENKNKNLNISGTEGSTKLNLCKLNDCVSLYETAETRGRLSAAAGIHQQRNLRTCAPSQWSDGATGPPALLSSVDHGRGSCSAPGLAGTWRRPVSRAAQFLSGAPSAPGLGMAARNGRGGACRGGRGVWSSCPAWRPSSPAPARCPRPAAGTACIH